MIPVPLADATPLRAWFAPERPGPLVFKHMLSAGVGRCLVDRRDDPQVVLAELPGNIALRGDPPQLTAGALDHLAGFVDAPPEWLPVLRAADPATAVWDRVVATLPAEVPVVKGGARLLGPGDAAALAAFEADGAWIHETWGGPAAMAASGMARGAFDGGRLVAVATAFFVGDIYEDLGVVTDSAYRGRGLSTDCSAALVADVRARGRIPTWTTSPDNAPSLAVADRLGFQQVRTDVLYALRVP
ncbi:MAG: GNAT family N-acetyltransferase, partial [Pseudonocardia sp.]|nr:GNAT family N-acetyltransferase [Pseudonocardia sp.]